MGFPATPGLGLPVLVVAGPGPFLAEGPLVLVVGGPSPILAEGPGCGFPPLLAAVRWFLWRQVVPRQSWLTAPGAVPATPRRGPLVMVAGGPSPILAEGPRCGSPPLLAGVR